MKIAKPLSRLIESFQRLPGIGPKTAQRLTYYLLHVPQDQLDSFSEALATERELYPPIMAKVIKGAERSGVLDETLLRLAKFYERELKLAVKDLTSLIEPILIVMLGMGVVGVALAVVLPVYRLTSQIR